MTLKTKLACSKEDPVVELIEKVSQQKNKKFKCLSVINVNLIIQKKVQQHMDTKHLKQSKICLKCNSSFDSEVNCKKHLNKKQRLWIKVHI